MPNQYLKYIKKLKVKYLKRSNTLISTNVIKISLFRCLSLSKYYFNYIKVISLCMLQIAKLQSIILY